MTNGETLFTDCSVFLSYSASGGAMPPWGHPPNLSINPNLVNRFLPISAVRALLYLFYLDLKSITPLIYYSGIYITYAFYHTFVKKSIQGTKKPAYHYAGFLCLD